MTRHLRSSTEETLIEVGRAIDIYGNQIESALGDYRLDIRGDIYERHAPDTALPTLDPPTS